MSVKGAAPIGATNEEESQRAVRDLFNQIAPRYDLLNRVLSLNLAELWWRRAARSFAATLARPQAAIVDLCCGTGSMTKALLRHRPHLSRPILALDFSPEMLARGAKIFSDPRVNAVEANAMQLPLENNSTDLVISAFGFRNLPDYDAALREVCRVLKPGGQFGVLEANEPPGVIGRIYDVYFHRVLPHIGALISGAGAAYRYLPYSVARFPSPPELESRARSAGFSQAHWQPYTFATAGLYTFTK